MERCQNRNNFERFVQDTAKFIKIVIRLKLEFEQLTVCDVQFRKFFWRIGLEIGSQGCGQHPVTDKKDISAVFMLFYYIFNNTVGPMCRLYKGFAFGEFEKGVFIHGRKFGFIPFFAFKAPKVHFR